MFKDCALKRACVELTGSPPQSPPESGEWARPRSDRATLHALLWCDLLSFHNFLHDLWRREVHNLCLLEHELSHLCDFLHDLPKTVVEKKYFCTAMIFIRSLRHPRMGQGMPSPWPACGPREQRTKTQEGGARKQSLLQAPSSNLRAHMSAEADMCMW